MMLECAYRKCEICKQQLTHDPGQLTPTVIHYYQWKRVTVDFYTSVKSVQVSKSVIQWYSRKFICGYALKS